MTKLVEMLQEDFEQYDTKPLKYSIICALLIIGALAFF